MKGNYDMWCCFSVTKLCPTLQLRGLQHARLPCPSPSARVGSNSCPSSRWCHPTISSSVTPFSSCLQSFPASGSFPMSQFFASSGQSIRASASVLPMNIQAWFPSGWTGLTFLLSKRPSRASPAPQFKSILLYGPTLTSVHDYWKNHSFDYTDLLFSLVNRIAQKNQVGAIADSCLKPQCHL